MNFTEKGNGKSKLGLFNRKAPYRSKNILGRTSNSNTSCSKKDSTPSSKLNWGKSRQSISSFGDHTDTSIGNDESRIILALSEGRGEARCEVGLAVINISQPHLILCQISDTQSYDNTLRKINIFNPSQILVPMTFLESANQSRLIEKVKEQFSQVTYVPVRRNTYNKTSGMEFIQELCVPSLNSVLLVLQYRYYALTAASALFKFLQNNLNIFYASGSINIEYQESEGYALIDVSTADRLELVSSTKPLQASKYSTLFGVLNNCYTRIGERALRTLLLQPPFVTSIILERQQCVTSLMRHPEKLQSIQVMLQKLGNVDQLLSLPTIVIDDSPSCSNRQLNYILYLNGLVDLVITLSEVTSTFHQSLFKNISVTLKNPEFLSIRDLVRTLIHENAYAAKSHNGVLQRCFAIKPGINGLLDLVRKIYSERLDDMREYVKTLAEKYDLPLTLGNNITKGYHIVLSLNKHQRISMKKSDIPKEFIQVCRLAGSFTMKTMELINFQTRIDDIIADILKISNVMIFKTLTSFKKHMGLFYRLCEDIATIDVLQSLAEVSIRNNYVKPTFSDFTEVKESQHPMLDMLAHEKPIPNLISSSNSFNIHIITGPNGSGKSIYIRQVMLLQIMAQIGCYVPALSAIFRPADRLFARVYLEDNMECGASSFVLEMKEIIYILTNITDSSLIIIDELARSTSLEEGASLAMAICECFVNSSAFVYLTSHFTLVTKLGDLYLNVKNWFMEAETSGDTPRSMKLNFKHCIKTGVTNLKRYGIFLVKDIWPTDLLEDVYSLLEQNSKAQKEVKTQQLSKETRLKYDLNADLLKCNAVEKKNPSKINEIMNFYQTEFDKIHSDVNLHVSQIDEPTRENLCYFDDTVPDDILSEAVDQAEYSIMLSEADPDDSSYKKLSYFIGENSANINLLNPEINIQERSESFDERLGLFRGSVSQENINFNPKIKILSNVVLNRNQENPDNAPVQIFYNNDGNHLNNYNVGTISQETYHNSQEFEEVNEINRSILTEMHIVQESLNAKNLDEDELAENAEYYEKHEFTDSIENFNPEEKMISFNSENRTSDFCFLKPTEPPLKKRLTSKVPVDNFKVNFNETDQISFSLGLNRDKTSTPMIAHHKQDQKMHFTNDLRSHIDNSYIFENVSSYASSQVSSNTSEAPIISSGPRITTVCNEFNEKINQQDISRKNDQGNHATISQIQDNVQKYGTNSNMHIFPNVQIIAGPNNKSISFGEEDKSSKMYTRLQNMKEDENISMKMDFEKFAIEETRFFLSNSADIFDEDIDALEISIDNNETNKKSHEEVSENIISMLKVISPKQKPKIEHFDEIIIEETDNFVEKPTGIDNNVSTISGIEQNETKLRIKTSNMNSISDIKEISKNNEDLKHNTNFHCNLFEESDLDSYINSDLTIPKECSQKSITNFLIHNDQKCEKRKECINEEITTEEKTNSSKKNTTSTSLSEASKKRKLDNSSNSSVTTSNENEMRYSHENKNTNNSKTSSESFCINQKISDDSEKSSGQEMFITSISDASKKRNLDYPISISSDDNDSIKNYRKTSDSSSNNTNLFSEKSKRIYNEKYPENKQNSERGTYYETAQDTDLSSISNQRNLDRNSPLKMSNSNIGINGHLDNQHDYVSQCSTVTISGSLSLPFKSVEESSNGEKINTLKTEEQNQDGEYDVLKVISPELNEDESNSTSCESKKKKYLGYRRRPQGKQPKRIKKENQTSKSIKLTKTQIQEEFDKQDEIILDENLDVETYNKYLIQRMNRPSVKQIQNAEHIATFRKTENGTIVIPTRKTIHKPRKSAKVFETSKIFDVSIFSDQNAGKMSAFLASNERNYDQFKFEPNVSDLVGSHDDSLSRSINFCSQFMQRTKKIEFSRTRSLGNFKFQDFPKISHNESFQFDAAIQSQRSNSSSNFLPNGFFKENKKEIDNICSKYLGNTFYRNKTSPLS